MSEPETSATPKPEPLVFVDVPLTTTARAVEATKRIQALCSALAAASQCDTLCSDKVAGYTATPKIIEMANALLALIQNSYL